MRASPRLLRAPGALRTFDVVCAGEALWNLPVPGGIFSGATTSLRFRPGGGAVNAALALAREGLSVGLATVLGDDASGHALLERIAISGVDVGGVVRARPRTGVLLMDGTGDGRNVVSTHEDARPLAIPAGWSSQVLLLSGVSPHVAHAAALCKAARAARRLGTIVVVDANARWHAWAGHDARALRSLLREADVVRCSAQDLAALDTDVATVRSSLRANAILVTSDATGDVRAAGPFGEVAVGGAGRGALSLQTGAGDLFAAVICAELARAGSVSEGRPELWQNALRRGQAAGAARRS